MWQPAAPGESAAVAHSIPAATPNGGGAAVNAGECCLVLKHVAGARAPPGWRTGVVQR
ncbi:MAG: hypothetical protein AVDCRST_MAG11-640 [uncultured Gemmatimonadaceae bacterium]|uniref:Uncharacterized protein n=1 Tax=uncultured Gemmatimonadaceae bacterium TaxID=246130 RepID=A0A6J4K8D0_9BACT|nr:MAG: hypothetical protein AVDCRST_MAG11-640 [uncultured Gemmatimonadaceae bacterium]